jgi:pimeloyl-ACP methyl ester carboxylesterase
MIIEQNNRPAPETKTWKSLMMCVALLLGVLVSTTEAAGAQTTLESLGRYTCPTSNGLLNGACREAMFVPCGGAQRVAVTTDQFVGLRASIQGIADGDTWEWFWYAPNGKILGPTRTTFRENVNGQKDCFVFSNGVSTLVVCGARTLDAEWGQPAIHDDNAVGLWNVEVRFNGQQALLEPFELVNLPRTELQGFSSDITLTSDGTLGLQFNLQTPPGDPGLGTKLRLGLSPSSLSSGQQTFLSPGPNSWRIKLSDHAIGRFENDAILTVQTETPTSRPDLQFSPTLKCGVPPIAIRSTLAIPLPVVFIHGLIPPQSTLKGQFTTWIASELIEPYQMKPLFEYLAGATNVASSPRIFNTSDFRLPYSQPGESQYPTLYFGDWRPVAYSSPEVVATELEKVIDRAISGSYAKRVNLIGHSAGGVVSRYLVQRGVGRNDVKISKLILVGSPNNGTSDVYLKSNGMNRSLVDHMANGIAGFMVPPSPDPRGPYAASDPCSVMFPTPLRRTYDDSIPIPADVRTTNIIGVDINTAYDITAKPLRDNWYSFEKRVLRKSDGCADLKEFRTGDGSIARQDALLPSGNVEVQIRADLVTTILQNNKLPPHVFLLHDTKVRREILRALEVLK